MKRGTKALLIIFIAVAVGLYIYLFVVPKIAGMNEKTVVLEHGDLPVMDKAEALIIRDETLFGTKKSGAVTYKQDEGTKVRKGVKLITVEEGAPASTDPAIREVKTSAGDSMKMTGSFKANRTAVVSYYADGYEKILSAKTMGAVTKGDMPTYPKESSALKRDAVVAGDPIYKLTNNNEWYMIYWVNATDGAARYVTGAAVTVTIGDSSLGAEVYDVSIEGDQFKVILRSDMYYKYLTRVRKADAEIVFAEYSGLIIDKSCIITREGAPGVFVKQRSEGYKWIPVKILKSEGDKCTLAVGVYYDDAGNQVRTVNYYDEALANPKAEGYE
ncbi:MAG: hypothetical protein LBT52_04620 [Clostridiales Family XIII bacterium]|jgi:putative membrane fusion protein|nr:hypothetical protein [Clostridiales Family XIII bacterium]